MKGLDLENFRPASSGELLDGIAKNAAIAAADAWKSLRDAIVADLQALSENAFQTQMRLSRKSITQGEADFLVHMQELYFHQVLLHTKFLSYVAAQAVLDAVFGVIAAAIKNVTGVTIKFG